MGLAAREAMAKQGAWGMGLVRWCAEAGAAWRRGRDLDGHLLHRQQRCLHGSGCQIRHGGTGAKVCTGSAAAGGARNPTAAARTRRR